MTPGGRPGAPGRSPGHAPVPEGPVAALRRVAWLLERAQADGYRAAAFRQAVRVLEPLGADRVGDLVATGSLTDLPGVGARTAQLVTQVVRGEPVPYLEDLERAVQDEPGADPQAVALRACLRGDLHAHTEASDGTTSLQEMVLAALELGHEYLAVTDHSPHLTVAHGLSAARLRAQGQQIEALRGPLAPFRVLRGIEVDILADGSLDQDPDLLAELDVVVASVHSDLRADEATMTTRMLTAVRDPHTDVLGHCTGRRVRGKQRPPSRFDARAVFEACAEHGVAVEINCRPDRQDPPEELLALAAACGCLFAIDTDAHAPGHLAWQLDGCARAARHGITADRVVNTLPVEQLVARHGR
ncbi:PHP domain-containing protein [Cellulomonas soli]|uniref:PHP domain-containing protein n=1 Tax=Cellulomonas soli TaxID=931535 RepID=UPI003F87DFFB